MARRRTLAACNRPHPAPHEEVRVAVRIIIGLALTVAAFAIAGRRLWWLYRVARTGQPAPERVAAVRGHPGRDASVEATEVIGQRKLLQWTGPGIAHALTFWGFIVLLLDHLRPTATCSAGPSPSRGSATGR
jgi:hypothetical protein